MDENMLDCLIIGGGPAGLTAAIYCARFLLTTLVIDAGGGRARSIPATHNHAGFPGGIPGRDLLDRMREQALENGARIEHGSMDHLSRHRDYFAARYNDRAIAARTVLIATGISDRRPNMPAVLHDEALAKGLIRYCPVCDGFEVIDKCVAVIGTGSHGAREASFLRSYTRKIALIAPSGGHDLPFEDGERLARQGVRVIAGPACEFEIGDRKLAVRTAEGRLAFDAVYPALGADIHSDLAVSVGAKAREGGCLIVDDHARTSVKGLYAAGDVVLGLDQISGAMGQAALAATTIRNDLGEQRNRER